MRQPKLFDFFKPKQHKAAADHHNIITQSPSPLTVPSSPNSISAQFQSAKQLVPPPPPRLPLKRSRNDRTADASFVRKIVIGPVQDKVELVSACIPTSFPSASESSISMEMTNFSMHTQTLNGNSTNDCPLDSNGQNDQFHLLEIGGNESACDPVCVSDDEFEEIIGDEDGEFAIPSSPSSPSSPSTSSATSSFPSRNIHNWSSQQSSGLCEYEQKRQVIEF
jgi:hypothetical protein